MRSPHARSRSMALMALAVLSWTSRPSASGQEARPPTANDPDAKTQKRIEDLDKVIDQQVEAGQIAEAVPPAQEKLDLLVRLRGTDHWQTGDARRDAETCERIAALPRAVHDRFAEARRRAAQASQLFRQGQYAQASALVQQILATDREPTGGSSPAGLPGPGPSGPATAIGRKGIAWVTSTGCECRCLRVGSYLTLSCSQSGAPTRTNPAQ